MKKRYLVVGINDYTGIDSSGTSNLYGCVADARSMSDLLLTSFGFDADESVMLLDQQASSGAIRSELQALLQKSEPGDVACFYYAGHGARVPAVPGQGDCDTFYETIVPASGPALADRDLFRLADSLEPSRVNFTVILDSCHSGGMDQETDAGFKCRTLRASQELLCQIEDYARTLVPCGILVPADSEVCAGNVTPIPMAARGHCHISEDPDKVFVDLAKTTLVAGCKFDEVSNEINGHGLLTQAFLNVVNASGDFQITHGELLDQLRASVRQDFETQILPTLTNGAPRAQTPQLRGQRNRMGEGFLQPWTDSR